MADDIAIKVDNLTKTYKLYNTPLDRLKESINFFGKKYHHDFHALSDITLEIKKGETVGIIGQNGAGKSTLLKLITGILTPTKGSLNVTGRISALLELGAGFNPQMTGLENVFFNGTLQGFSKEEMNAKLDNILDFADIGDFVHQPVRTYSSGMFVRLAFAVAVHIEPEILIIDEALAVGDVMFQSKCFDKIKSLMKQGVTTLFVTHNMSNITTMCNRAFLLDGGVLFAEGNPKDVTLVYYELQRKREHQNLERQKLLHTNNSSNTKKDAVCLPPTFKSSRSADEHRFGSQAAEITDFKLFASNGQQTLALETGERFKVWMRVEFYADVKNPSVAAMFRNPQGQNLLGIHSFHEMRMSFGPKSAGDHLCVSLESEMLLNPGKYTLNLGVADQVTDREYQSVDVRNNVTGIEVYGKEFHYGLVHNPGEVYLEVDPEPNS